MGGRINHKKYSFWGSRLRFPILGNYQMGNKKDVRVSACYVRGLATGDLSRPCHPIRSCKTCKGLSKQVLVFRQP